MKICREWEPIKYIEATCPYCHVIDTYFGPDKPGEVVQCKDLRCKKRFVLGDRE